MTSKYVFTYSKRNISRVDRAVKGTLERAGIENCRLHDLRHTCARHVLMRGESQNVVNFLNGLTSSIKSDMSQNVTFSDSAKTTHG